MIADHRKRLNRRATPGPLLFARYAFPPNRLGYCGPGDPDVLFEAAADGHDLSELSHLASQFDGAWPYLELIASCNGIDDPLDERVVEAYWVGNALLRGIPASVIIRSLTDRFAKRAGMRLDAIAAAVLLGGVAQHSFHVFAVYPWLGLLRAGMEAPPLIVLDRCRIRSGVVEAVAGDTATVRSRHLTFDGSQLSLGAEELETARVGADGLTLAPVVVPGDTVSLHWDWVCDRLDPTAVSWLTRSTVANLAAVNALPQPGPATVSGA
jgi:Family of unknown function (DUF6390)